MGNHTPFELPDRFWAKTRKDPSGCLIWTASLNSKGYGCFSLAGRIYLAHRIAYMAAHGDIPKGYEIDHLCRVRECVRADHLEAVTGEENNRRRVDALTLTDPATGERRYPIVTHDQPNSAWSRNPYHHADLPYLRQRCPFCPDLAA